MRKALTFAAGLAVAVAAAIFAFREPPERKVAPVSETKTAAGQRVEGLRMEGADPRGRRWFLDASNAVADAKGSMGRLTGVKFLLETPRGPLEARAGACDVDAQACAALEDGVEIVWGQWKARLDEAQYLRSEGRVVSSRPVEVTGQGVSVRGEGIDIDVEAGLARVKGRVRAVLGGKG